MGKPIVVVGAGMVGLATAWHLQELGFSVKVLDRSGVAAGSSWGNAGWLTPALTLPLNDPSTLAGGLREVFRSNSPVYIRPTPNLALVAFLARFARNATPERFRRSLNDLTILSSQALASYDELAQRHPELATKPAEPHLAAFRTEQSRAALVHEYDDLVASGLGVEYQELDAEALHARAPHLGTALRFGLETSGQRFIDPGNYVEALSAVVMARGGEVISGANVVDIHTTSEGVMVSLASRTSLQASRVVIANGAWLPRLARKFGVKTRVQAGRGYSFSVNRPATLVSPLYLPEARVACTPLDNGRLRVAGMMEFRDPEDELDRRRIRAVEGEVCDLLTGIDWDQKSDEWVGSRPCTPDGLPLLGQTKDDRVFVAGGHGMWGIALGPLSGRLVAEVVAGKREQSTLTPFDPLR